MAGRSQWLRQWFVVPPFVGSSPIVRPSSLSLRAKDFHTRMLVPQPEEVAQYSLKSQYSDR